MDTCAEWTLRFGQAARGRVATSVTVDREGNLRNTSVHIRGDISLEVSRVSCLSAFSPMLGPRG